MALGYIKIRSCRNADRAGPGPAAYSLPPQTGKPCQDVRKQHAPAYTMAPKNDPYGGCIERIKDIGPGPLGYCPKEPRCNAKLRAPAYSFGRPLCLPPRLSSPGPLAYLPKPKKAYPAYSMGAQLKKGQYTPHRTPGPCYDVCGKPREPKYTMRPKTCIIDKTCSPGPAAYGITDVNLTKRREPKYSVHERKIIYEKSTSPGPASYCLKSFTDDGPKYSFGAHPHPCHNPCEIPTRCR